jgi:hypothetical protein
VLSTVPAVARQFQNASTTFPEVFGICDPTGHNVFTLMSLWMVLTPEFQLTIVLISSPLALLVALWGMRSKAILLNTQLVQQNTERK